MELISAAHLSHVDEAAIGAARASLHVSLMQLIVLQKLLPERLLIPGPLKSLEDLFDFDTCLALDGLPLAVCLL